MWKTNHVYKQLFPWISTKFYVIMLHDNKCSFLMYFFYKTENHYEMTEMCVYGKNYDSKSHNLWLVVE